MNEVHVTLVGWLAQDPHYMITQNGVPFLSLRVGCTPRRFDRQTGQWQDMESMFLTVNCWRGLADNVNSSQFKRGDPVLVTGRLRIRQYVKDEQLRFSAEVEAGTLGHDLTRGSAEFHRVQRGGGMTPEDRREAEESNDRWAEGGLPMPTPDEAPGAQAALGADGAASADRADGRPGDGRDGPEDDRDGDRDDGHDDGDGTDAGEGFGSYDLRTTAV